MKKCKSSLLGWYNLIESRIPMSQIPKSPMVSRIRVFTDHFEVDYMSVKKNGRVKRRTAKYDFLDLLDMDDTINRICRGRRN